MSLEEDAMEDENTGKTINATTTTRARRVAMRTALRFERWEAVLFLGWVFIGSSSRPLRRWVALAGSI